MTQEMASQGLSVIYQLGNADVREKLLSSLMGTLQGEHALSVTCLQDARKPLECKSTLTYKFHNTTCMFLACLPARFSGTDSRFTAQTLDFCYHMAEVCRESASREMCGTIAAVPLTDSHPIMHAASRRAEEAAGGEAYGGEQGV
jgi:hypothetical protein